MRYLSAQPANIYYSWQVDTMIFSFLKNGINQEQIDIVFADRPIYNNACYYLVLKYPKVNFYFYSDTRLNIKYISSVRPHILKKHFYKYPHLYRGTFLYHDCDIALTKPLELDNYLCGCDSTCYLSNTTTYIGYEYILSKGRDVLDLMLKIVDIDESIIKNNQKNSGGCQYLLKNIDYKFWEKVEIDCENLFTEVTQLNIKKQAKNSQYHPLQIWCADMWAVLWNLWKDNRKTKIIDELEFTWATHQIDQWGKHSIFHNAGVNNTDNNAFFKAKYLSKRPTKDLKINPLLASYNYYELVKQIL